MVHRSGLPLPHGVSPDDVAAACRRATREFLALEPTKRALAAWLMGPYRVATSFLPRPRPLAKHRPGAHDLHDWTNVLVAAQAKCIRILKAIESGPDALINELPERLPVITVKSDDGRTGFAPLDLPRLHLVDRVASLILADHLAHPQAHVLPIEPSTESSRRSGIAPRLAPDETPTVPRMRRVAQ